MSNQRHPTSSSATTTFVESNALSELLAACAHSDTARITTAIAVLSSANIDAGLDESSQSVLKALHDTLWGLRGEFDPASVTMTSTNIPDAIVKLSAVLHETNEASQKVFSLIDKHNDITKLCDSSLAELELLLGAPSPNIEEIRELTRRCKALNQASQTVAHEIIMAQEFQDLCGQRVKKVMKLLSDMECYLRSLLASLGVDIPSAHRATEEKETAKELDQTSTDTLLKELGF